MQAQHVEIKNNIDSLAVRFFELLRFSMGFSLLLFFLVGNFWARNFGPGNNGT